MRTFYLFQQGPTQTPKRYLTCSDEPWSCYYSLYIPSDASPFLSPQPQPMFSVHKASEGTSPGPQLLATTVRIPTSKPRQLNLRTKAADEGQNGAMFWSICPAACIMLVPWGCKNATLASGLTESFVKTNATALAHRGLRHQAKVPGRKQMSLWPFIFTLTSGSYISSLLPHTTNLQMDSSCLPSSLGTFSDMCEPVWAQGGILTKFAISCPAFFRMTPWTCSCHGSEPSPGGTMSSDGKMCLGI